MKLIHITYSLLLIWTLTSSSCLFAQEKDTTIATKIQISESLPEPVVTEKKNSSSETTKPDEQTLSFAQLNEPGETKIITPRKILWSIIFLVSGYFSITLIVGFLDSIAERSTRYRIAIKRIVPIVKITCWMLVIFIIIQAVIRPPVATVLAFFTSIAVAVGFAAQDLLKNIFGGLMILFDHPFQVGDKIEIGGNYGEVKDIGLRSTRIITADDSMVSVPNSEMMNKSISNTNVGETNCQVVAEIYLPLNVDTERVRKLAIESAQVSNYIYLNKPIKVIFINEMHDRKSILKMRLKAYVSDIRHEFLFKSDMTEIVMKTLIKENIINPDNF